MFGFKGEFRSGFRRFGDGEAFAPDVHEWLKVAAIGGFQRRKVGGATGVGVGFENDAGEVEPASVEKEWVLHGR